jgi:hypothetical protein
MIEEEDDDDDDVYECEAVGGMIGRGSRSTRRKPVPVPLCPAQIPNDLTRTRTWTSAFASWRLTTGVTTLLTTYVYNKQTNKQTPWPLARKRTILTERPPLVDEI